MSSWIWGPHEGPSQAPGEIRGLQACAGAGMRTCPVGVSAAGRGARGPEAQVLQDGEDAAVVVVVRREAELREDGGDVLLDAAPAQLELIADRLVGAALGDQREHLALARAERRERSVVA